jgi:hypothetical protein
VVEHDQWLEHNRSRLIKSFLNDMYELTANEFLVAVQELESKPGLEGDWYREVLARLVPSGTGTIKLNLSAFYRRVLTSETRHGDRTHRCPFRLTTEAAVTREARRQLPGRNHLAVAMLLRRASGVSVVDIVASMQLTGRERGTTRQNVDQRIASGMWVLVRRAFAKHVANCLDARDNLVAAKDAELRARAALSEARLRTRAARSQHSELLRYIRGTSSK